jgi:hypothetical protein
MERFTQEAQDRTHDKSRERCGDDAVAQMSMTWIDVIRTLGDRVDGVTSPAQLRRLTTPFASRLSGYHRTRLAGWVAHRHGLAFARRAGLPAGRPALRIAV